MSGRFTSEKLKILAMGTMFLDHAAAVIIFSGGLNELSPLMENIGIAMRLIGRMAFPLYAFLLVQGFLWTRDWKKYVERMALFALISEIPFNLMVAGDVWYSRAQNTIVTLLIGLVCMNMLETLEGQFGLVVGVNWWSDRIDIGNKGNRNCKELYGLEETDGQGKSRKNLGEQNDIGGMLLGIALAVWVVAAAMFVTELLRGDYGAFGVLLIIALYVFRYRPAEQIVVGFLATLLIYGFGLELVFAWIAFFFISRYNGERGRKLGGMPYVFYPVHLLAVWLVSVVVAGI